MGVRDVERVDAAVVVGECSEIFARTSTGWGFAELSGVSHEDMSWAYTVLAREALTSAVGALDISTGGGEFVLEVADELPPDTVATQGWPSNVAVASEALEPLGIPWCRIALAGSVLVTQRVEAENLNEVRDALGSQSPYPSQTLLAHVHAAVAAGLVVERAEPWGVRQHFRT